MASCYNFPVIFLLFALILIRIGANGLRRLPQCEYPLEKFAYETSNGTQKVPKVNILKFHNTIRRRVLHGKIRSLPRAAGMNMLKWNDKLQAAAYRVARTCSAKHYYLSLNSLPYGLRQNFYGKCYVEVHPVPWRAAIQSWAHEGRYYRFRKFSIAREENHQQFTQMIWASTSYVGCSYARYFDGSRTPHCVIIVCQYGPAGNNFGILPYTPLVGGAWTKARLRKIVGESDYSLKSPAASINATLHIHPRTEVNINVTHHRRHHHHNNRKDVELIDPELGLVNRSPAAGSINATLHIHPHTDVNINVTHLHRHRPIKN